MQRTWIEPKRVSKTGQWWMTKAGKAESFCRAFLYQKPFDSQLEKTTSITNGCADNDISGRVALLEIKRGENSATFSAYIYFASKRRKTVYSRKHWRTFASLLRFSSTNEGERRRSPFLGPNRFSDFLPKAAAFDSRFFASGEMQLPWNLTFSGQEECDALCLGIDFNEVDSSARRWPLSRCRFETAGTFFISNLLASSQAFWLFIFNWRTSSFRRTDGPWKRCVTSSKGRWRNLWSWIFGTIIYLYFLNSYRVGIWYAFWKILGLLYTKLFD